MRGLSRAGTSPSFCTCPKEPMDQLIALLIFLHRPNQWKEQVYATKYNQVVQLQSRPSPIATPSATPKSAPPKGIELSVNEYSISWYAKGLRNPEAFTTACWSEYPKGTKFKVTFNGNSVVVVCNDRGHFKPLGRVLDLSSGAFKQLAPLSKGIIRGATVEVLK